ncbi:MAG TPA: DUF6600 domain-containing protein [Terriglobales bacterium]|nr:DUF6600 domain-containing protein [Terriglobales bacterium]
MVGFLLMAGAGAQDQVPDHANDQPVDQTSDAKPPSAVARLSLIQGDVTTQRGDSGDWNAGVINQPLLTGDGLASGEGARAEVQLDFANRLRLRENAQVTLTELTQPSIQLQVGQGIVDYVVLDDSEATSQVHTPNLTLHPQGGGVYRVQVNSPSETVVIVRSGSAEVSTDQGSATLHAGQMITVEGAANEEPQYQIAQAPEPDEWDQWNQNRDRDETDARSWSNANRYYTGVSDLDAYGHWVYVPGYGQVWSPIVEAGWVPYSAGRWVWEPYYGWTWVSTEAWGWAPYHYGRWFYYGTSWVWWPGPVLTEPRFRPVWAPAYVSFIGLRAGGVSVGVGFGSVGWLPIGPGDPYRPWYGDARVRVSVVAPLVPVGVRGRIIYSNLNRMTTDPVIAHAVVAVSSDRFGRGDSVVHERVSPEDLRQAQVISGRLPMGPARDREPALRATVTSKPQPATRPGFHRFGETYTGTPEKTGPAGSTRDRQPAPVRSQPEPVRRAEQPAPAEHAATPSHANDPSWHKFGANANSSKNDKKKPPAKSDGRGGPGAQR